jgi:hypothetical protein
MEGKEAFVPALADTTEAITEVRKLTASKQVN